MAGGSERTEIEQVLPTWDGEQVVVRDGAQSRSWIYVCVHDLLRARGVLYAPDLVVNAGGEEEGISTAWAAEELARARLDAGA